MRSRLKIFRSVIRTCRSRPFRLEEATPGTNLLLNVRTTLHPDGVDIEIPIDRDELILEASPTRVQGMGLEQATLTLGPAPFWNGGGCAVGCGPRQSGR